MTCKDCIHSGLCYKENDYENFPNRCGNFIPERPQGDMTETKHRLNLLIGVLFSNQVISENDIEYIEDSIKKLMKGGAE